MARSSGTLSFHGLSVNKRQGRPTPPQELLEAQQSNLHIVLNGPLRFLGSSSRAGDQNRGLSQLPEPQNGVVGVQVVVRRASAGERGHEVHDLGQAVQARPRRFST